PGGGRRVHRGDPGRAGGRVLPIRRSPAGDGNGSRRGADPGGSPPGSRGGLGLGLRPDGELREDQRRVQHVTRDEGRGDGAPRKLIRDEQGTPPHLSLSPDGGEGKDGEVPSPNLSPDGGEGPDEEVPSPNLSHAMGEAL